MGWARGYFCLLLLLLLLDAIIFSASLRIKFLTFSTVYSALFSSKIDVKIIYLSIKINKRWTFQETSNSIIKAMDKALMSVPSAYPKLNFRLPLPAIIFSVVTNIFIIYK